MNFVIPFIPPNSAAEALDQLEQAEAFLHKPYTSRDLPETLRQILHDTIPAGSFLRHHEK